MTAPSKTLAQLIAYDILATNLKGIDFDKAASHTSPSYLAWMCIQIASNPQWDLDKAHRWIGFVQGVMIANNLSKLDIERNRVRSFKSQGKK